MIWSVLDEGRPRSDLGHWLEGRETRKEGRLIGREKSNHEQNLEVSFKVNQSRGWMM